MKYIEVFLRSGETIRSNSVSDSDATILEKEYKSNRNANKVYELIDSDGKALFHMADVISICINEWDEENNKIGFHNSSD